MVALLLAADFRGLHQVVVVHALRGKFGARLHLFGGEIGPRALVQHGIAEVDVIHQHQRRGGKALILHHVVNVQLVALGVQCEAAGHQHVGAEYLRLAHLAGHAQHLVVALVVLPGRDAKGGQVVKGPVQAQRAALVVGTRGPGIGHAAGGQHAGVELLQEAVGPLLLIQIGRAHAHLVQQADVDALVGQIRDVHAAVGQNRQLNAPSVFQLQRPDAPGRAVVEHIVPDAAQRGRISAPHAQRVFLGFLHGNASKYGYHTHFLTSLL